MKTRENWTDAEISTLRQNYSKSSSVEDFIANHMPYRTYTSVVSAASRYKITMKDKERRKSPSFDAYQQFANSTRAYGTTPPVIYPALGLAGEAGETVDKIKKLIRDSDVDFSLPIDRDTALPIAMELGDVLWYVSQLSRDLGYSLEEIAMLNISKLKSRVERGTIHGSGDER